MTDKEFVEYARKELKPTTKLVRIRERYESETEYRYYNILLFYEPESNPTGLYIWEWDYDEGEQYIEVLGYLDIEDIDIPLWEVDHGDTETWNGYHGQITAPKGTFKKIFEESDEEE